MAAGNDSGLSHIRSHDISITWSIVVSESWLRHGMPVL